MARPGYTNIRPTAERDRLFSTIAAAQGMDAQVHKHRVEMIDQGLRLLAQKMRRGTMKNIWFCRNCKETAQGFGSIHARRVCSKPDVVPVDVDEQGRLVNSRTGEIEEDCQPPQATE